MEAVRRARDELSPHFAPSAGGGTRSRIRYSDTNYQVLVVLAEHVTGKPMEALYREPLFEPLALGRTWLPGSYPSLPVSSPATVWLGSRLFDDPATTDCRTHWTAARCSAGTPSVQSNGEGLRGV